MNDKQYINWIAVPVALPVRTAFWSFFYTNMMNATNMAPIVITPLSYTGLKVRSFAENLFKHGA
jgi:hypothetical protein